MNQSKLEIRKVRDFGGLLNITFDYIKRNFKILFKSNLLISAPAILLAGVFLGIYQSSMFTFDVESTLPQIGIPFLLSTLFMIISYMIIMVVTYSHLMVYKQSENGLFDVDGVWQFAKQNFSKLLITAIGYTFIVGLIAIVFIGLGAYLISKGLYIFILLILFGIGFAIYITINYSLIFIIRLEEGMSFGESLKRSKELISDNWWFTFGLFFVVGIIQSFIMYALYIPTYIVMFFVGFAGYNSEPGGFTKILYIITSILTSLGALLYTISTIATAFQYYNLVERKEAPGLLDKIGNIK